MTDKTEATPKTEKAPKSQLAKANGVTRPTADSKTGRVWAIADELSAAIGKPALRKDVIAKGVAEGINPATLATQYGRWRRFFGLAKEPKAVTPAAEPAAPATVSSDVVVEQK